MRKHLIVGLLLLIFTGLFISSAIAIEEPTYRVIEQADAFELRVYDPKIIAEVEVTGTLKQASNKGFRLIADYIFGNNTSQNNVDDINNIDNINKNEKINMTVPVTIKEKTQSEKISMTAPVSIKQTGKTWRLHFVMPSKYTLKTLPKPNNAAVKIRQIQGEKYAVIRFSGLAGKTKTKNKTVELRKWLSKKNITPTGEPELARYNPPITLPFLRRNEVMMKY